MRVVRNNTLFLSSLLLAVLAIEIFGQRCVSEHTYCPGRGWVKTACNAPNPCGISGGGGGTGGSTAGKELGAAIGTAIGQVIGDALTRWLRGNPEQQEEMRRQLRELEEQRYLAAQEKARGEAMRVEGVFRRLNSELKLAGLPTLTLKEFGTSQNLGFKDSDRIAKGTGDLKLKLGESTDGYGIPGLPGIYTGGARPTGTPTAKETSAEKGEDTLKLKLGAGYGIPGLPGIYAGGARPGTSIFGNGIDGLPGIYLNGSHSGGLDQAKQLAGSAEKLPGPEKALAEAAAVDAAMQDPDVLAGADEKTVAFRDSVDQYTKAREAEAAADEALKVVQKQADVSRAIAEIAEKQLEQQKAGGLDPTVLEERKKDLTQIVAGAKTDEEATEAAKVQFETATADVTMTRSKAVATLRGVPPTDPKKSAALSASANDFFKNLREKLTRSIAGEPSVLDLFNELPAANPIPAAILEPDRTELSADRSRIEAAKKQLSFGVKMFQDSCEPVKPGLDCTQARKDFDGAIAATVMWIDGFNKRVRESEVFALMVPYIKNPHWSAEERDRLSEAFKALPLPEAEPKKWNASMDRIWRAMESRQGADLEAEANKVRPPVMVGAGTQSFQDCAVFALANASGTPYSVVAARVADIIKNGGWRGAAGAATSQKVIEEEGLVGGEVIFAAEALGTVAIVTPADFAKTLDSGTPIMVHLFAKGGGPHQIVLTRSFQHTGETWYEMIDSNQGPIRRLYLSHAELTKLLKENGVVYRPEKGTVPLLLK